MWDQIPGGKYANAKVHTRITQKSNLNNLNFKKQEQNLLLILSDLYTNPFRRNIFLAHINENCTYLSVHMTLIHILQLHSAMLKQCHDLNFTCGNLQRTNNE